jgi:hypothetical protein
MVGEIRLMERIESLLILDITRGSKLLGDVKDCKNDFKVKDLNRLVSYRS